MRTHPLFILFLIRWLCAGIICFIVVRMFELPWYIGFIVGGVAGALLACVDNKERENMPPADPQDPKDWK